MEETELNKQEVDFIIDQAFREDIGTGDITSNSLIPENATAKASMTAKADGVIAGLPIAMGYGYTAAHWVGAAMAGTGVLIAFVIVFLRKQQKTKNEF